MAGHGLMERTCTAELQTMLGVTASFRPAALRFSCQRRLKARPPSRMACTGSETIVVIKMWGVLQSVLSTPQSMESKYC